MNNLLPVTLGNIIGGGIFVGMWYRLVNLPADQGAAGVTKATSE